MWIYCIPHSYGPSFLTTACLLPPHMPFFLLHSSDGDTVCLTLFVVPILACLLPFWLSPTLSPTSQCPCLPTEQTFTVSHFFHQKGWERPPRTDVSNQTTNQFPLSCRMSQYTRTKLASQVTGHNGEERVADRQLMTQDISLEMSWCPGHQNGLNDENYIMQKQTQKLQLGPISGDSRMSSIRDFREPLLSHSIVHLRECTSIFSEWHPFFLFFSGCLPMPSFGWVFVSNFHFLQQEEHSIRRTGFLSTSVHPCFLIPTTTLFSMQEKDCPKTNALSQKWCPAASALILQHEKPVCFSGCVQPQSWAQQRKCLIHWESTDRSSLTEAFT